MVLAVMKSGYKNIEYNRRLQLVRGDAVVAQIGSTAD
jgi:hypothetical protein